MSLRDPLFDGFKVIAMPKGGVYVKCMSACRRHGQRVEVRTASLDEARRWVEGHRRAFPLHGGRDTQ